MSATGGGLLAICDFVWLRQIAAIRHRPAGARRQGRGDRTPRRQFFHRRCHVRHQGDDHRRHADRHARGGARVARFGPSEEHRSDPDPQPAAWRSASGTRRFTRRPDCWAHGADGRRPPARNSCPIGNACSLSAMPSCGGRSSPASRRFRSSIGSCRTSSPSTSRRSKAHRMARPLRPWPLERERRPIRTGVKSVDCTALCPGARALRILEREPFFTRHTSSLLRRQQRLYRNYRRYDEGDLRKLRQAPVALTSDELCESTLCNCWMEVSGWCGKRI